MSAYGDAIVFLAIRVRERGGTNVFEEFGVAPHPVAPLLRAVGDEFEADVLDRIAQRYSLQRCGEATQDGRARGADNFRIVELAQRLGRGKALFLAQPAVAARLGNRDFQIEVFGNIDLLRLFRNQDGEMSALIIDIKRASETRLDHRLQTAMYALVLEQVFATGSPSGAYRVETGILRSRRDDEQPDDLTRRLFGCEDVAVFNATPDEESYRWAVDDLVLSRESAVRRAMSSGVTEAFSILGIHCDGCVNQEVCHVIAESGDDLSLVPGLTPREKRILLDEGVHTLSELADSANPSPQEEPAERGGLKHRLAARLGAGYPALLRRARTAVRARTYHQNRVSK